VESKAPAPSEHRRDLCTDSGKPNREAFARPKADAKYNQISFSASLHLSLRRYGADCLHLSPQQRRVRWRVGRRGPSLLSDPTQRFVRCKATASTRTAGCSGSRGCEHSCTYLAQGRLCICMGSLCGKYRCPNWGGGGLHGWGEVSTVEGSWNLRGGVHGQVEFRVATERGKGGDSGRKRGRLPSRHDGHGNLRMGIS